MKEERTTKFFGRGGIVEPHQETIRNPPDLRKKNQGDEKEIP